MSSVFVDYHKNAGAAAAEDLPEDIQVKIANMPLAEAVAFLRWKAPDGAWWYRVEYKKTDARATLSRFFDEELEKFPDFNVTAAMQLLEPLLAKNELPLQTNTDN
jgi:hypothetical protein